MNKENNKSAAGLRRSAIVERIRLKEEWSALKGVENRNPLILKFGNKNTRSRKMAVTSDVLCGVVALVDVGVETKALVLRAALTALGASVVPRWSPLVTHLVWSEGGCRGTRAKARALASRLVSPLWVEACAAANSRLPEYTFPAVARASDLPSPRTLRRLLKQAEMQNVLLTDLLCSSRDDDEEKTARLRISSENDKTMDTTADTSHDKSAETSHDRSKNHKTVSRTKPPHAKNEVVPSKCKRKLFTYRDGDLTAGSEEETDPETPSKPKRLSEKKRRALARAGRVARRLAADAAPSTQANARNDRPKIVLSGMSRTERHTVFEAVKKLNGLIQKCVNKKTTHILLGSCISDASVTSNGIQPIDMTGTTPAVITSTVPMCDKKSRTLNALEGAVRGCRVLYAQWALDSAIENNWLHHNGYEVAHLKKISQKARVERKALCRMHSEYAYDVFYGLRVRVMPTTDQKDAAVKLLTLCGAIVQDGGAQNGGEFDITIGNATDEVNSKWVFDSVVAARMRTTRRYVNTTCSIDAVPSGDR